MGNRFTKIFASSFSLFLIMVIYIISGGFIFRALEKGEQQVSKETSVEVNSEVDEFVTAVQNETNTYFGVKEPGKRSAYRTEYDRNLRELLVNLSDEFITAIQDDGWGGEQKNEDTKEKWSISNSILFAATVVTTIGYGNIAPKTPEGQIFCIFYAFFGLPITFISLARIGRVFGLGFRIVYYFGNKRFWGCMNRLKRKDPDASEKSSILNNDVENNATTKPVTDPTGKDKDNDSDKNKASKQDNTTDKNNSYVAPQTFNKNNSYVAPQGLNDHRDQEKKGSKMSNVSRLSNPEEEKKRIGRCAYYRQLIRTFARRRNQALIRVPISISAAVLVVYVMLGALIFITLEPSWTFSIGFYFCFVTVSTIGFGDYVFGDSPTSTASPSQLVFTGIYILLGLSICSMIIDLVADELMEKIHKCAIFCGLVKVDDEDDDDEEEDEEQIYEELEKKDEEKDAQAEEDVVEPDVEDEEEQHKTQ